MSLPADPIPAEGFTLTNGRRPRTGETKLMVQYRNGWIDPASYTAGQMRWDDSGSAWDIVAVRRV